jgi:hypothetical protein
MASVAPAGNVMDVRTGAAGGGADGVVRPAHTSHAAASAAPHTKPNAGSAHRPGVEAAEGMRMLDS